MNEIRERQVFICAAGLFIIVLSVMTTDKSYYQKNTYAADKILAAYQNLKARAVPAQITRLTAPIELDAFGYPYLEQDRNDSVTEGASPIACYNPVFGYRLENFPVTNLHAGNVFAERNGVLNLKNPACYVYPRQNNCVVGDQFTVQQQAAAQNFASYRPYGFAVSRWQRVADGVNGVGLAAVGFSMLFL